MTHHMRTRTTSSVSGEEQNAQLGSAVFMWLLIGLTVVLAAAVMGAALLMAS